MTQLYSIQFLCDSKQGSNFKSIIEIKWYRGEKVQPCLIPLVILKGFDAHRLEAPASLSWGNLLSLWETFLVSSLLQSLNGHSVWSKTFTFKICALIFVFIICEVSWTTVSLPCIFSPSTKGRSNLQSTGFDLSDKIRGELTLNPCYTVKQPFNSITHLCNSWTDFKFEELCWIQLQFSPIWRL